ncbi:MAG: aldehyde dehydrogenase family protein [Nitrososphaeria archaeon]
MDEVKPNYGRLPLHINGECFKSKTSEYMKAMSPAFDKPIAEVPVSRKEEVDEAVKVAEEAFERWRELPITTRASYIFRLKQKIDEHIEEISRITT